MAKIDLIRQEQAHINRLSMHIDRLEHEINHQALTWIGVGSVPQEIIDKNSGLREQQLQLIKEKESFERILHTYCIPLLEFCGETIHDAIQEKYGVNGSTTVEKVPHYLVRGGRFYREVRKPTMLPAANVPMLPTVARDVEAIDFDLWAACADCYRWRIGYSVTHDTLFIVQE